MFLLSLGMTHEQNRTKELKRQEAICLNGDGRLILCAELALLLGFFLLFLSPTHGLDLPLKGQRQVLQPLPLKLL